MLRRYLIIDGYNLMHACGLARKTYARGQLQRCRSQLIRYLARHLGGPERERTTIVFDAAEAPPGLPRRTTADGMSVCFASPGKEADDTIEDLIAAHSAPRQIRLVSSDHRLQRSVRRRRGTFVDSDQFVAELDRRGLVAQSADDEARSTMGAGEKAGLESDMDAEIWLKVFGDISESSELGSDRDRLNVSMGEVDLAAIEEEIDRQKSAGNGPAAKRPPGKRDGRRRRG